MLSSSRRPFYAQPDRISTPTCSKHLVHTLLLPPPLTLHICQLTDSTRPWRGV